MASSSVVVLEPWVKGGGAVSVGREWLSVGPLGLQCAVEPLHLAVLPGAVRSDELLPDATCGADIAQRVPVRPGIVGDEPLDPGDAVGEEVIDRTLEGCGTGRALLIG